MMETTIFPDETKTGVSTLDIFYKSAICQKCNKRQLMAVFRLTIKSNSKTQVTRSQVCLCCHSSRKMSGRDEGGNEERDIQNNYNKPQRPYNRNNNASRPPYQNKWSNNNRYNKNNLNNKPVVNSDVKAIAPIEEDDDRGNRK